MVVAILGASDNPERYSNMALKLLIEHKHTVIPVAHMKESIDGIAAVKKLSCIEKKVDVLTIYVGADKLENMASDIVSLNPKLVIFNPGTECKIVQQKLIDANIKFIEACTLVLLKTNRFEKEVG